MNYRGSTGSGTTASNNAGVSFGNGYTTFANENIQSKAVTSLVSGTNATYTSAASLNKSLN